MVPGGLIQLRLEMFLQESKGFVFILVEENFCKPQRFLGAKIHDHILDFHPFSSPNQFLNIDFEGNLPEDFTFPWILKKPSSSSQILFYFSHINTFSGKYSESFFTISDLFSPFDSSRQKNAVVISDRSPSTGCRRACRRPRGGRHGQ
jgi:hypothetical protein